MCCQRARVLPVASSLLDSERPAKAQSMWEERDELPASFKIRMSTKNLSLDVRTSVDVGSDGGSGSHWMKARVEMLGGDDVFVSGLLRLAITVCIFSSCVSLGM